MGPMIDVNEVLGKICHVSIANVDGYVTGVAFYQDASPMVFVEWTDKAGSYQRNWFEAGRCTMRD